MRFKTIILKRQHIIFCVITILVVCMGLGLAFGMKNEEIKDVFSSNEIYDDILREGLPQGEKRNYFKEILDSLMGFDAKNPLTILEKTMPLPNDNQKQEIVDDMESEEKDKPESLPSENTENISYPTKEQIEAFSGVEISNATGYNINSQELIASPLGFDVKKDSSPQVLIVHTHTTESYGEYGDRNADNSKNVVAVGREIKNVLESEGIGVIHDETFHDYPSYQGAYTRALTTINKNLNSHPDIKIVLDIHRDGYVYADGTKLKKVTQINGKETAQVMIVSGSDSMGLENPNWRENLKLGTKVQSAASIMYPTLMRPINLRRERFNLHLTTGSLLIEVGANGNTLSEAVLGGHYFAKALVAAIK